MNQEQHSIIESIGIYLPPETVSTSEVMQNCTKQVHFPLEKITGIKNRRMAGKDEFSIDLARKAVSDCLEKSKYHPADIDVLVCCNISRYDGPVLVSFEPCTSVKLRNDFGFTNAMTFDISNACAGMFTGIYLVDALIRTGAVRRGMIVSGEYITHLALSAQKTIESFMDTRLACLTLGDAGAALILEGTHDRQAGFRDIELRTFGGYSHFCIAKMTKEDGIIMYTDSVNMTEAAIKSGAKNALQVLQRAAWPPDSFQHLIMHQTSGMTLNSARQEINRLLKSNICHDGNTINNVEQRGNTASTSHFIAVADHIRNNHIQTGDKIVFSITGSGLTTGTALYVFDDLPDRLRLMDTAHVKPQKTVTGNKDNAATKTHFPGIRVESVGTVPAGATFKQNTLELLQEASGNCLDHSVYNAGNIGLLIYCGVYRTENVLEPAYATLLAGALDMNATLSADNNKTLAFDIFNGAVGFLNACYVVQQLIAAGNCSTAMIVAAENKSNADMFHGEWPGIRETASAVILDADPSAGKGFSRFLFRYHPGLLHAYTTFTTGEGDTYLHVNKAANLEFLYVDCILPAVHDLLQEEGLNLSCIDMVFPPQVSQGFIARLSEALQLPREKFVDVVGDGPDLFSSALPYALEHAFEKGLVKTGDTGLIIAVGSGIQVGCAVYHF